MFPVTPVLKHKTKGLAYSFIGVGIFYLALSIAFFLLGSGDKSLLSFWHYFGFYIVIGIFFLLIGIKIKKDISKKKNKG
jgi:hypothetical protein